MYACNLITFTIKQVYTTFKTVSNSLGYPHIQGCFVKIISLKSLGTWYPELHLISLISFWNESKEAFKKFQQKSSPATIPHNKEHHY